MDAARVVPESIFGDPTRTNPTHQLNDPTQPIENYKILTQPDSTQRQVTQPAGRSNP